MIFFLCDTEMTDKLSIQGVLFNSLMFCKFNLYIFYCNCTILLYFVDATWFYYRRNSSNLLSIQMVHSLHPTQKVLSFPFVIVFSATT